MAHPVVSIDTIHKAYSDAYSIAWIGACNVRAVDNHLFQWREILGDDHPAVRAIAGHMLYLRGYELGPDADDLEAVRYAIEG